MTTYQEYTWVCTGDCDALIKYTIRDGYGWANGALDLTCPCGSHCVLLSVADVTIKETTTEKEPPMETTSSPIFTAEYLDAKIVEQADRIKQLEYAKDNLNNSVNRYYTQEQALHTYLIDNYNDLEHHAQAIADIFSLTLTKEVSYNVVINATISAEVPLEELDSIEEFITSNLTLDSYSGEISVDDFTVESFNESYY